MSADKQRAREARRLRIGEEILATERSYIASLRALVEVWLLPLSTAANSSTPILSNAQIKSIFSNIKSIYDFHTEFIKDMMVCSGESPAPTPEEIQLLSPSAAAKVVGADCFGQLFVKYSPFFKMYTDYVNNHNDATQFLAQLHQKKGKKFSAFEAQALANPLSKGMSLESFLIMPVQRVPRYRLLLNELIKNTEPSHPDYAKLNNAYESIKLVAKHINEALRYQENMCKIVELMSKFSHTIELMVPGRTLLWEGSILRRTLKGDHEHYVVLFTDLLVLADGQYAAGKLRVTEQLPVDAHVSCQCIDNQYDRAGTPIFVLEVRALAHNITLMWGQAAERDRFAECLQEAVRKAVQRSHSRQAGVEASGAMRYVGIVVIDRYMMCV
jgi:hypothetical protein